MPELPDLEVFRQYFDATGLHQRIQQVEVREPRLLEEITTDRFRTAVTGHQFEETRRHGKYLFGILENETAVIFHFGMTGFLQYYQDPEMEPDHVRVLFTFESGYNLAYDNMRMLGKVGYTNDPESYIRNQDLGPDVFNLEYDEFEQLLGKKRGMLKSAFMDQNTMAGLGNIYTDELLFHAGFHPKMQVTDLTKDQIHLLFDTMREVLRTAIDEKVNPERFPPGYLLGHREEGEECPKCGRGRIQKIKVSSRSTYFCPAHQGEGMKDEG